MEYISVSEFAKQHGISQRTVRNYCATGKIEGVLLIGKTWSIPRDAELPKRKSGKRRLMPLLAVLRREKEAGLKGGIYHRTQIDLTYNSNHIEGSRLTHEQTRYIFETNTIGFEGESIRIDDIIETTNHFRCIDFIIESAEERLTEKIIKELHKMLKANTSDTRKEWFAVGEYKHLPNEVGGNETTAPENVHSEMQALLKEYNSIKQKSLENIIALHQRFECIHPFQDGNGRVGRLIMFKECLKYNIPPFIIEDRSQEYYTRGLREYATEAGYLVETSRASQDAYKKLLEYFEYI